MSNMTAPVAIALNTPSPIYSPNAELKMDYANFTTLQVLEEELDRLRKERQARRLSMLSEARVATSASPPPQFKRRASIPDIQSSCSSPPPPHRSLQQQQREEKETDRLASAEKPDQYSNTSQEEATEKQQTEVSSSPSSPSSLLAEAQFEENSSSISSLEDSDNEESNIECPIENQATDNSTPPLSSSIQKMELNNSMEKEDKLDASLVIKSDDNLSKQHRLSESSDETVQKEDPAVVLPPKPTKSKFIQRERKPPLRIQTMFDRHQLAAEQITQQNNKEVHEENALLLHARRNLKSAPSPPPLATVPSTSKSTSALHKLNSDNNSSSQDKAQESVDTAKRTSLQLQSSKSAQTTNRGVTPPSSNRAFLRQRQYDSNDEKPKKPRPLSDAFIGVKGLSKKFDSTTSESLASTKRSAKFFMRDEPPLLSTASQSVSRGRKTSTTTPTTAKAAAGVSALSQIFSSSSSSSSTGSQKEKSFKSKQSMRQYKALPPVKQPQQQSSNHNKKRIDPVTPTTVSMSLPTRSNSKKAESHRIFHKTMPAIPVTSSNSSDRSSPLLSRYPNPLPVYMPQLAQHPINDQQQSPEQIKVAETAIAPSSLSSTSSSSAAAAVEAVKPPSSSNSVTSAVPPVETSTAGAKKRVSFSSVITSIPPPSPFSDDESEDETNKRRPLMTMSSAHLLSQWQQKHEKGLRGTTTINPSSLPSRGNPSNNDTRGFWEAFSTEMNNRAAPGLRQAAVAKEKQQPTVSSSSPLPTTKTTTNRFIPSTYVKNSGGGKPLPPIVSNEKQQEQQPLSPRKTWINLLQDRLGKKSSSESILENSPPKALARPRPVWGMSAVPSAAAGESSSMNQHQQQQQNKKPAVASRKPVVAPLSFDDYPTSSTPPLHHPTKTRPKKPSSFRKSQGHHQLRNNLVGPEVSVPPVAVQRPWHRNY